MSQADSPFKFFQSEIVFARGPPLTLFGEKP